MDDGHEPPAEMPSEWAQLHGWVKLMEWMIDRAEKRRPMFFDVNPPEGENEYIETVPAWAEHPQTLLEFIEPHYRFLITQEAWRMTEGGELAREDAWDCMERDEYITYLERVVEHLNAEFGDGTFAIPDRLRRHLEESPGRDWCYTGGDERITGPLPDCW